MEIFFSNYIIFYHYMNHPRCSDVIISKEEIFKLL